MAINAAPDFPDLGFYRGERLESTLAYLSGSSHTFDADAYNFRLRVTPAGTFQTQTLAVTMQSMVPDVHYTYVIMESGGNVEPLIFEQPRFSPGSAEAEFTLVHAVESLGAVDIYVEAPNTDLATVTPRASLSFRQQQPPLHVAPNLYQITVTAAGDPATVLFTSQAVPLSAGRTHALVLGSGAGIGPSQLALVFASDASTSLVDINAGGSVRVINGALDRGARDVYANGDFSAPLVAATPFGGTSSYAPLAVANTPMAITPADNPSVIEREFTPPVGPGVAYDVIIVGETGNLTAGVVTDNRRVTRDEARLKFVNAVNTYTALNVYLVTPGTDVNFVFPTYQVINASATARQAFGLAPLELVLRDAATGTTVFGPQTLSFPSAGLYTIVAFDSADATTVDIVLLDDFP